MNKMVRTDTRVSWKDLSRLFPPSQEESEKARTMFISYEKQGYLGREDLSPAMNSREIIIDFYHRLSLIRSGESPVRRKKKSDWILQRDYARFNHRDLPLVESFPLLAQLAALPSVRAGALVLSPFTANRKKELNTVDSHSLISRKYCDPVLTESGLSPDNQFHLFIDAVHLLGKCVGYTLDYRMDRFAVAVLRRPDLFRWIDVNSGLPYREMLTERGQKEITDKVRALVDDFLKNSLQPLSDASYERLRNLIKDEGFWTVPSCRDGSEQLPFYKEESGEPPVFIGGEENLTSFKFHISHDSSDSLRPQRHRNEEAVNYYSSLYIKWRDSFSFDFMKIGSIDHIDDEPRRKADSPDLEIVKTVIKRTTSKISHTGIIGSDGENPEVLLNSGFDVLLHDASGNLIDRNYINHQFRRHRDMDEFNRMRKRKLAAAFPCGGDEQQFCRKVFISRFLSTGSSNWRKYETKTGRTRLYHSIENIYTRYRDIMEKGELVSSYADDTVAWWVISHGNNLLIPLISLDKEWKGVPGKVEMDYSEFNRSNRILSVLEYDFSSSGGDLFLCGDDKILCEDLKYGEFRLFSIQ